jgi:serine/threonine protein kinase
MRARSRGYRSHNPQLVIAANDSIGPYRVSARIGRGGMGEVFKAHDPRLGRDVALKVSYEAFTDRFTREARSIAALNHTNICHLYDVGPDYLVMEFVEGESLHGPMSFDEALPIINQLIDGIEAAHERNIIHRDLKPANIKIMPNGIVKILDFGLAKALAPEGAGATTDLMNSPTVAPGFDATAQGTILGTAAYMAPEQARRRQADRRRHLGFRRHRLRAADRETAVRRRHARRDSRPGPSQDPGSFLGASRARTLLA